MGSRVAHEKIKAQEQEPDDVTSLRFLRTISGAYTTEVQTQATNSLIAWETAHTMALPQSAYKDREFLAVIGDEVQHLLLLLLPTKPFLENTHLRFANVGLSHRYPTSRRWRTSSHPTYRHEIEGQHDGLKGRVVEDRWLISVGVQ